MGFFKNITAVSSELAVLLIVAAFCTSDLTELFMIIAAQLILLAGLNVA
jgi:hypothetical protein